MVDYITDKNWFPCLRRYSACRVKTIHRDGGVKLELTRSSWLNCALRDDEAVYWVSIGHYEAVAVGN